MQGDVRPTVVVAKDGLPARTPPDISVIVPIYNEEESIPLLVEKLSEEMAKLGKTYEVLLINDGSTDKSLEVLRVVAATRPNWRVVSFRRNCGQTAAMMAGIDYARAPIIVSLDCDLQNDTRDIPLLLNKLEEGYDVVCGWRKERRDEAIRRNFVSRVANRLISWISGVSLHDYGCTLKAYRADVVTGVRLYGEMHRFIPIYATWRGARVTEVPVRHHARKFGHSKYGLERIIKVILDLLVVKFLDNYMVKPIYVFGSLGLVSLFISLLSGTATLILKIFYDVPIILTPLPLLTVLAMLLGMNSILMGLIAEMLVRTYYESQERAVYAVREIINADAA